MLDISAATARRYVMGRQGLWPGRRWQGLEGAATAMRAMEHLQLDPLVVVARAHDIALHSRVVDYAIDDWARLTYDERRFFEWGGWLAVRPIDELPYWRLLMRRDRDGPYWSSVARDHAVAIAEMRALLGSGRELSNRDLKMGDRVRIDSYRGRKDSALALHYLWRIGDAMVTRRDRFERVYAATEAVAPRGVLRDVSDAEAEEMLLRKHLAAEGLTRLKGLSGVLLRPVPSSEVASLRERWIEDGVAVAVRVEGWKVIQLAPAEDAACLAALEEGAVPSAWMPLEATTAEEATFLSPLDPVSARGRARLLFDFEYTWEVYTPAHKRRFGYYALPILWGDRLVGRFDPKLDRSNGTLVILGLWLEDEGLARDPAFVEAMGRGMARFIRFLAATRIDASAVSPVALRRRLERTAREAQADPAVP